MIVPEVAKRLVDTVVYLVVVDVDLDDRLAEATEAVLLERRPIYWNYHVLLSLEIIY